MTELPSVADLIGTDDDPITQGEFKNALTNLQAFLDETVNLDKTPNGDTILTETTGVKATTADMNIYVATTGSDTTGDGSSGSPYKTIGKALAQVPQIINHDVYIRVADGTYTSFPDIKGFAGEGELVIKGSSENASVVNINSPDTTVILVRNMAVDVSLRYMSFKTSCSASEAIRVEYGRVSIANCVIDGTNMTSSFKAGVYASYGSQVDISNVEVKNLIRGFIARKNGIMHCASCSGSAVEYGYYTQHGGVLLVQDSTITYTNTHYISQESGFIHTDVPSFID